MEHIIAADGVPDSKDGSRQNCEQEREKLEHHGGFLKKVQSQYFKGRM
jgi:hypothetical protein